MPPSSAIRAGRAFVEIFADNSKLVRGLKAAQARLKAFGTSVRAMGTKMMAVGGAITAPLIGAAKVFSSMGDDMAKMAARTGVSVENLSELGYAADQSGASLEVLEGGVRNMQKMLANAAAGGKSASDALRKIGLTAASLADLSPDQQFKLIADKLANIQDPAARAATAMAIFGKSGTQLLPLMANGAAGIEQLQQRARELGLTMSTEDAKAAEVFSDAMSDMWKTIKMAAFTIGAALAPTLQEAAQWITRTVKSATEWIKKNQGLIVSVFKIAAGVVAAGAAFVVLGTAIKGLGLVFGGLVTIAGLVHGVLSAIVAVIGALFTPLGIVIAAVVSLGAIFLYASGAIGKAMDWLAEGFGELADEAKTSFGAIGQALASGDIALAARVLWAFLKLEWEKGCALLEKAWLNFRNFFIRIGYDAFYGLLAVGEYVWHGLEVAWIETTSFMSQTWTRFTSWMLKAWTWCGNALTKAWNKIKGLFDDSFDADAANAAADQAYEAGMQRIEQEKNAKLAEREQRRVAERDQAKRIHEATLAEIGKEALAKEAALDKEYNDRIAKGQAAIDAAKKEWQSAIAEVTATSKGERKGPGTNDPLQWLKDAMAKVPNTDELLKKTGPQSSSRGTFNAAAIQGLQSSGMAERTAKATEETAKSTEETKKFMRTLVQLISDYWNKFR